MDSTLLAQTIGIPQECITTNVALSKRTWIHRGGIAAVWVTPRNIEQLEKVGRYLYNNQLQFDIVGYTSNTYFTNTYDTDYVIDTKNLRNVVFQDNTIICDCGASLQKLARECIAKGIMGYEGFYNIPGTIAGGVVNNSGCYGSQVDKVILSIDLLMPNGDVVNVPKLSLKYRTRSSALKRHELQGIILKVYLDCSQYKDPEELRKIGEQNQALRQYQHEGPTHNLGSVFVYTYTYKKNIRNLLVRTASKIMRLLHIDQEKQQFVIKWMLMILYGYTKLDKYISDKNLKCFLWKEANADEYFDEFVHFFNAFANNPEIEIEIKR